MSASYVFHSGSESDTRRFGEQLAGALPDGSVVGLSGPLGAGKTRLVQGIAAASGVNVSEVVSPTYVVLHEYHGRRPIFHFDLYRLKDDDEFLELGAEEYFEQPGISLLEWADRFEQCLPGDRLDVHMAVVSSTDREIRLTAHGTNYEAVIEYLCHPSSGG